MFPSCSLSRRQVSSHECGHVLRNVCRDSERVESCYYWSASLYTSPSRRCVCCTFVHLILTSITPAHLCSCVAILMFLFSPGPNDAHKSLGDIKIPDKDKKDKKKALKLNSLCTHFSRCDMLACGTSSGLVTLQVGFYRQC